MAIPSFHIAWDNGQKTSVPDEKTGGKMRMRGALKDRYLSASNFLEFRS